MRILTCLHHRRAWPLLCAVFVACWWTTTARSQRFPPDPVEEMRKTLKNVVRNYDLRKKELAREIGNLRTLGELRRALVLQEWRDDDLDDQLLNIDQPARALVSRRFDEGMKAALLKGNTAVRLAAADMLADLGVTARAVGTRSGIAQGFAPELITLTKEGNPLVRVAAAHALGEINPDPAIAVPALAALLNGPTPQERVAAADALTALVRVGSLLATKVKNSTGPEGSRADLVAITKLVIPVAAAGLANKDLQVRRSCAGGMLEAAAALNRHITNPSPEEGILDPAAYRREVEDERAELMPLIEALRNSCPDMAKALSDPDRTVRLRILDALEDVGHARLLLIRRLMGANVYVPNTPLESQESKAPRTSGILVGLNQKSDPPPQVIVTLKDQPLLQGLQKTFAALESALQDRDPTIRLQTLDVIETLGPEAKPMSTAIVRAMSDPVRFVRWAASRAVGKAGPIELEASVPALVKLTHDQDLDLCLAAATALDRFGPAAKDAVLPLIPRLQAPDAELRIAIIKTLTGIGQASAPAVPAITALLRDPDSRVRTAAAESLGRFGSLARSAVDALEVATDDSSPEVRKAASDAILSILPTPIEK